MLERIQKMLDDIKGIILNNADIRKLLYHDSNNALNMVDVDKRIVDKYVTLHPIYQFENKDDYSQNSMINIYLSTADVNEEQTLVAGVIRINILINLDRWDLVDGKNRALELVDRIYNLLNNKKIRISNPIVFDSFQEMIASKTLVGYAMLFSIVDGISTITL